MKKILGVVAVFVIGVGVIMADEFQAVITKVDGNKVTYHKLMKKEKGDAVTADATGAKVVKGKFNKDTKKVEAGDAIEGGLKNEAFSKDVRASIVTEGEKITEIRVFGGKKKNTN